MQSCTTASLKAKAQTIDVSLYFIPFLNKTVDEFVVKQLSLLADEDSEYFEKLLNQKASDIFSSSQNEKELSVLRKKKAHLETAIANQVKNLRDL